MRLYVLVEGQSEEAFVTNLLSPHLLPLGVWAHPMIVQTRRDASGLKYRGGGRWMHWERDLHRLTNEQRAPDVRFTTLFDLYGLPTDFPEYSIHQEIPDTVQRACLLEGAMATAIGDRRLIPNIMRHEFETLVFAALESLESVLGEEVDRRGLSSLKEIARTAGPEEINGGHETAPSKRLMAAIPVYRKTFHGPLALADAGLPLLRSRCPRFDAWVSTLEALGSVSPPGQDVIRPTAPRLLFPFF